jgi:hypothetical protein
MTTPAPLRTSESLRKEKIALLNKKDATPLDFIRLADDFALLGDTRQFDVCMMWAKKYESRIDPDTLDEIGQELCG